MFWPFIGRAYRPGGVCIVGWNLHHNGEEWYGLGEEFVIAEHNRGHLGAGFREDKWGSRFAYRSLAAGLAVADSLDGATPIAAPAPEIVAAGMERLARLQTVKCAPLGDTSNPEPEMTSRCPRRFLVEELALLRPRALVIFGTPALNAAVDAIEADHAAWIDWDPKFETGYARGTMLTEDGDLTVFGLRHPRSGDWPRSQEQLVNDLHRRPLRRAAA